MSSVRRLSLSQVVLCTINNQQEICFPSVQHLGGCAAGVPASQLQAQGREDQGASTIGGEVWVREAVSLPARLLETEGDVVVVPGDVGAGVRGGREAGKVEGRTDQTIGDQAVGCTQPSHHDLTCI